MLSKTTLCILTAAFITAGNAASAQSPDTTKIIIGQSSSGPAQIPLYIALDQGFFKKAGLDVSSQTLSGGSTSAAAAFVNGSLNMLNASAPEIIQYTGKKILSGKAFAEMTDQSYDLIGKDIASITDIKGKSIAISAPNAADHIYLLAVLQHYGVKPNEVTFISSGNPLNRLAAMSAGAVQMTAETNTLRADSNKAGTIILKSADSPIQFPTNMFIASNDLINNHKPMLKTFVGVLRETIAWMKANPEKSVEICAKAISASKETCDNTIRLAFDKSVASKYTWSDFTINAEGVKGALAVMAAIEPDTKGVTFDDVTDLSIAGEMR